MIHLRTIKVMRGDSYKRRKIVILYPYRHYNRAVRSKMTWDNVIFHVDKKNSTEGTKILCFILRLKKKL